MGLCFPLVGPCLGSGKRFKVLVAVTVPPSILVAYVHVVIPAPSTIADGAYPFAVHI